MINSFKHFYEFGHFRLDPQRPRLLRDGEVVPVSPKALEALVVLVRNSGKLLEREQLMQALWADTFVEDANLTVAISNLRKTLGQNGETAEYIETVPRVGYRFVANVREVREEPEPLVIEKHTLSRTVIEEELVDDARPLAVASVSALEVARPVTAAQGAIDSHTQYGFESRRLMRQPLVITGAAVLLAVLFGGLIFWRVQESSAKTSGIKSIAVLPFRDLGKPSDDDHLGLGMADVLITRLSKLKQLNVRPTSAVMKYEQEQDLTAAARSLGVDAFLEGSIQRVGERIRVTARLVRVSDRSSIWSGQFDEKARDILALQDAISEQVVDSFALNLSAGERARLTKHGTENADAYQLYLKGRYHWNKRNNEGMERAQYYFRRATEEDPGFALAYLGFADVLLTSWESSEAQLAVLKAIELDGALGEAYATMGFAKMFHRWEWKEAEEAFKRAVDLSPGYGTAHQWYAALLAITGRVSDAKREIKRALEIDPMSHNFLADMGQMNYFAREYGEAEAYCRKALEVYPNFTFAHEYLFEICFETGRLDEAFEEYIKWQLTLGSDSTGSRGPGTYETRLRSIYQRSGMPGVLRSKIDEHMSGAQGNLSYQIARAYAMLGEKQQTLDWLEKACDNKNFMLAFVDADPVFDDLHSDPRFQAVLRRMGLAS